MNLTYNGITLAIYHIGPYEREAIIEGGIYRYTRFRFKVLAIYNPGANSGTIVAGRLTPRAGVLGAVTDSALRHTLLMPRKQLTLTIGNQITLLSPLPGFTRDANNGPKPLSVNVTEIVGRKSMFVELSMETCLNEYDLLLTGAGLTAGGFNPSPILSQLWDQECGLDDQFYETRVTTGQVVFRTDVLAQLVRRADDFRGWMLGHPLLPNFKRELVQVKVMPEGNVVQYRIVDKEQTNNILLPNITKVEAVASKITDYVGLEKSAYAAGKARLDYAVELARIRALGAPGANPNPIAAEAKLAANTTAFGTALGFAYLGALARASLPFVAYAVNVKAYGNRFSSRKQMSIAAKNAINALIPPAIQIAAGFHMEESHDLMGKFVEVNVQTLAGPTAAVFGNVFNLGIDPFPDDDVLPVMTTNNAIIGPFPPRDGGTRGANLAALVTQALHDTGRAPPAPPNPTPQARPTLP